MTTQLRTDIENIPTDGRVVIIGTMAGEIFMSRFLPPDKLHRPQGRWSGHPYFPDNAKPLMSGEKVKQS